MTLKRNLLKGDQGQVPQAQRRNVQGGGQGQNLQAHLVQAPGRGHEPRPQGKNKKMTERSMDYELMKR